MDATFHDSVKLPKELQRELMKRSNHPAILQFLLVQILFFASGWLAVHCWNGPFWQLILSQLFFGSMCTSIFAMIHETSHKTAFRDRWLNNLAARIGGIEHLYASTAFQEFHFTHHRHTHEPGLDPEISFGNRILPSMVASLPSYLVWISGIPMLLFKLGMLLCSCLGMPEPVRRFAFPFIKPEVRWKLFLESWLILLVQAGIFWLAWGVHSSFYALLLGQVTGNCLLATYLVAEHSGLSHSDQNIMARTRSIKAPKILKWLLWNLPYHAEHHAYPAIPFHALPAVHEHLKNEILHKHETFPAVHLSTWKSWLQ